MGNVFDKVVQDTQHVNPMPIKCTQTVMAEGVVEIEKREGCNRGKGAVMCTVEYLQEYCTYAMPRTDANVVRGNATPEDGAAGAASACMTMAGVIKERAAGVVV